MAIVTKTTICRPSRLDRAMFSLEIQVEQWRAKAALRKALSEDVLGDTDSLKIEGDYLTMSWSNGKMFRRLLTQDSVQELLEEIQRERETETFSERRRE